MATLNEIQTLWESDCQIDSNHLDTESVNTPKLHAKYIGLLMDAKLRISKIKVDINILKKNKFRYYRGELTKQELVDFGWEQWHYSKPLKNEMEQLLEGDTDITKIKLKLEYLEATLYLLESIMKSIQDRTWSIKNAVAFKAFLAGA
jgi:hypothetical protein